MPKIITNMFPYKRIFKGMKYRNLKVTMRVLRYVKHINFKKILKENSFSQRHFYRTTIKL